MHARVHEKVRSAGKDPENQPTGPDVDRYFEVLGELTRHIDDNG